MELSMSKTGAVSPLRQRVIEDMVAAMSLQGPRDADARVWLRTAGQRSGRLRACDIDSAQMIIRLCRRKAAGTDM